MAAADLLALFAPELATTDQALIDQALALGLLEVQGWSYVPQNKKDEAQALYAAWVLSVRGSTASGGGTVTTGILIMEQAGDTKRQYASPSTSTSAVLTGEASGNYYARFFAIKKLAGYGSIMTRDPAPPDCVPHVWW